VSNQYHNILQSIIRDTQIIKYGYCDTWVPEEEWKSYVRVRHHPQEFRTGKDVGDDIRLLDEQEYVGAQKR
jgi:hypothetical protein